jgi:hypothetical protein
MSFSDKVISAVGNLDFSGEPVDEFVDAAFAVHAAALAKLPEKDCELQLAEIESDLRKAIKRLRSCRQSAPGVGWMQ